jgi:hypothetical protein
MVIEIFLSAACDQNREIQRGRIASEADSSAVPAGLDAHTHDMEPRLSHVSVSGYVRKADGSGLRNARLHLAGEGLEDSKFGFTDASGRFEFPEVPTGSGYRISVRANPQVFKNASRVIDLTSEVSDIEFVAESAESLAAAQ